MPTYDSPFQQIAQSLIFIRNHWTRLAPIVLLPTIPVILISIFAGTQLNGLPTSLDQAIETLTSLLKNPMFLASLGLLMVIQAWSNLTLLVFLKKPNQEAAIKLYVKVLPKFWPYLATCLLVYGLVFVLGIFFVVPGILALFLFSLFEVVMVQEEIHFFQAPLRSAALIKTRPIAYLYRILVIGFVYLTLYKLGTIIWPIDFLTWIFFPSLWFLYLYKNYQQLARPLSKKT